MDEIERKLFGHYRRTDEGSYVIDVKITDLDNLFNPYDPSPLSKKDIHPDILKMIFSQIIVFDEASNIEIHIHLPPKLKKQNLEQQIEGAIRHHFEYEALENEIHLKRRLRKGFRTFTYAGIIFISLFTASYMLGRIGQDHVVLGILSEGLAIGAWVSMWHPLETLLYDWLPLHEQKKKYDSLLKTKICFNYLK
jgi:hypothetical protein